MIDTVVLSFTILLTASQLADWDFKPTIKADGVVWGKWYKKVTLDNGTVITLTYYPSNPMGGPRGSQLIKLMFPEPMLRVEVSLPKVLWDNNVQMILQENEVEQAIEILNVFFKNKSWIPSIDIGQGPLWRIDFVFNHCAGALVDDYRKALFNITAARRKPFPYPHGVQFKSESKHPQLVTTFYDKKSECSLPIASGVLRQETLMRKPGYIEEKIGILNPTLRDITTDCVTTILSSELSALHLNKPIICTRGLALDKLKSFYKPNVGGLLYFYLVDRQTKTRAQLISEGTGLRSIQDKERKIIAAGDAGLLK